MSTPNDYSFKYVPNEYPMSVWASRFFRSAICVLKNVYNDYNVV